MRALFDKGRGSIKIQISIKELSDTLKYKIGLSLNPFQNTNCFVEALFTWRDNS